MNFSKDIWSETQFSPLWIYNLHYFEDLNNIDASLRIQQHRDLVNDWVRNYHFRSNRLGWHAFPISKRIVNWIKWDIRLSVLDTDALDSLVSQAEFLSHRLEKDLLANHLFANAKALIFVGLYFSGPLAERWFRVGTEIINEELAEQILVDGGQFELSPMYHADCIEDVLDLINVLRTMEIFL